MSLLFANYKKNDIFNWYLLFKYLLVVPGRESLLVPGGESPLGLFIFRKVFCKHKFLDNYFSNSISDNHPVHSNEISYDEVGYQDMSKC
mgnify:FL=1|jgi:hypothetical protein